MQRLTITAARLQPFGRIASVAVAHPRQHALISRICDFQCCSGLNVIGPSRAVLNIVLPLITFMSINIFVFTFNAGYQY